MTGADPTQRSPSPAALDQPRRSDNDIDTPHARRAEPIEGKPDQLKEKHGDAEDRQEALVDEGVEETFPASDPVSAKRIT
jgi:hypothetical protein